MGALYATRENVTSTLEGNDTTRFNSLIDDKLEASSRAVDALTHRSWAPFIGARKFDYPNHDLTLSSRLDLQGKMLHSATAFDNGGTALSPGDYTLLRSDGRDQPPYTHIEIPNGLIQGESFNGTWSIVITGEWDWIDTANAAELTSTVDSSQTTLQLSPLNGSLDVGVGSSLLIDDEWLQVTQRRWAGMGQMLSDLTANRGDQEIQVTDASVFAIDEILRIGAERVRVFDTDTDDELIYVERARFGTVLSAHDTAPTIWAQRTFIVERGAYGSTADDHTAAVSVAVNRPPGLIKALTIAECLNLLEQDSAAWSRTIGSGDNVRNASGSALESMRQKVYWAHAIKNRKSAI
jgi:hypothetical protein